MLFRKFCWFCIFAAWVFLWGCATMEKEECLTADWAGIGYEDGLKGHKPERIGKHRKACAKHDVTPDLNAYGQGYSKGLVKYCTPQKGYSLGTAGRLYPDICPLDLDKEFHRGYRAGRQVYLMEQDIDNLKDEIEALTQEINELDTQIKTKEITLTQDCKNTLNCHTALNHIRQLDRQKSLIQGSITYKRKQISTMTHTLNRINDKGIY